MERARISDRSDPGYVRSECVLYFLRRSDFGGDTAAQGDLFLVLRDRVWRAVRVPTQRIAGTTQQGEGSVDSEIREVVAQKFQELLLKDRKEYEENLDFYECRFNRALAMLRATARRDVRNEAGRYEPIDFEGDAGEPSAEVEAALVALRPPYSPADEDFLYREKLFAAINSLPPDQHQVIELYLLEVPIESQDDKVVTIATTVGCVPKTVHNRLNRAYKTLRDALKEEE